MIIEIVEDCYFTGERYWFYQFTTENGYVLCDSKSYTRKTSARRAVKKLQRDLPYARVKEICFNEVKE